MLSGMAVVNGAMKKYKQLKDERASILNTHTTEREMSQQYREIEEDMVDIRKRLAQYGEAFPGVLIPAFIQHMETLAKEEGVVISSISPRSQVEDPPVTKTPFQIKMSGKFVHLHRFLARLERSRPPVQIERVVMKNGEGKQVEVQLECSVLATGEASGNRARGVVTTAVFKTVAYGTMDPVLEKRRDIFFYSPNNTEKGGGLRRTKSIKHGLERLGRQNLSAIFYDGPNSMVLLNGVLLAIGDTYKGYKVISIERDRIILANDKKKFEIFVREK